MSKYKSLVSEMYKEHQDIFDSFKPAHDAFAKNQKENSQEFNRLGKPVMDLIIATEKHLCAHMDGGKYGVFTSNLSEKFREEIKKTYPYIDFIGVEFS